MNPYMRLFTNMSFTNSGTYFMLLRISPKNDSEILKLIYLYIRRHNINRNNIFFHLLITFLN